MTDQPPEQPPPAGHPPAVVAHPSAHPAAIPSQPLPPPAGLPVAYYHPIQTVPAPADVEYPREPSWAARHKALIGLLTSLVGSGVALGPKAMNGAAEGFRSYVQEIVDDHNSGHTHEVVKGERVSSPSHPKLDKSVREHDRAVREMQQQLHGLTTSLDTYFEQKSVDYALSHGSKRTAAVRSGRAARIYRKLRKLPGYSPDKAYEIAKQARIEDD